MASTETTDPTAKPPVRDSGIAGVEAGLDALETTAAAGTSFRQTFVNKILPPIVAVAVVLVVWQALITFNIVDDPAKLPSPSDVGNEFKDAWLEGRLLEYIWTSVSRGLLGFLLALAIGTPLGLLVARVKFVRAAIGPILSGLQSLPSVAWVPLGGDLAGPEQLDDVRGDPARRGPLHRQRPGVRHRPGAAAVPAGGPHDGRDGSEGRLAHRAPGLAARLPGRSEAGLGLLLAVADGGGDHRLLPDLGVGLGALLENGRNASSMAMVFEAIVLILFVGIAIDLLIFSPLERRVLRGRGLLVKG